MKLIALDRADHGQRRSGAAAGVLDDAHALAERAALLRAFDHRQRRAVFVGAGRIEVFELDDDIGGPGRHDLAQPQDRGVADGFKDGIDGRWGCHGWFDVANAPTLPRPKSGGLEVWCGGLVSVPHFLPARGMFWDGVTEHE